MRVTALSSAYLDAVAALTAAAGRGIGGRRGGEAGGGGHGSGGGASSGRACGGASGGRASSKRASSLCGHGAEGRDGFVRNFSGCGVRSHRANEALQIAAASVRGRQLVNLRGSRRRRPVSCTCAKDEAAWRGQYAILCDSSVGTGQTSHFARFCYSSSAKCAPVATACTTRATAELRAPGEGVAVRLRTPALCGDRGLAGVSRSVRRKGGLGGYDGGGGPCTAVDAHVAGFRGCAWRDDGQDFSRGPGR
jgi:hypothetical protein